jgi:hypothetical protein
MSLRNGACADAKVNAFNSGHVIEWEEKGYPMASEEDRDFAMGILGTAADRAGD